jgi:hypothetical protein
VFCTVDEHRNDQVIVDLRGTLDNIKVPFGDWVERTRVDCCCHRRFLLERCEKRILVLP